MNRPHALARITLLTPVVLILAVLWLYGGSDYFHTYPRPSWVRTEALATKSRFDGGRVRESHVTVSFKDASGAQHEAEYLALDSVARVGDLLRHLLDLSRGYFSCRATLRLELNQIREYL